MLRASCLARAQLPPLTAFCILTSVATRSRPSPPTALFLHAPHLTAAAVSIALYVVACASLQVDVLHSPHGTAKDEQARRECNDKSGFTFLQLEIVRVGMLGLSIARQTSAQIGSQQTTQSSFSAR